MDLGLSGKRALVTGGTRGIGRATVELLAAEGASVAFCARGAEAVETFADELRGRGVTVFARAIDVSKEEELKGFIGLYKEHRGLIHSGRMVRADLADESLMLHGVVAEGGGLAVAGSTAALFTLVNTRTSAAEQPGRIAIPGLAADVDYRVEAVFPAPGDADYARTFTQVQPPAWLPSGATASGRFLAEVGLPMPGLNPEHALLLKVTTA